jgi:CheY-like chemotaxis protein
LARKERLEKPRAICGKCVSRTSDRQALAAGADAFLVKPFEPLGLISTVKDLLGASAFLRGDTAGDQLTT